MKSEIHSPGNFLLPEPNFPQHKCVTGKQKFLINNKKRVDLKIYHWNFRNSQNAIATAFQNHKILNNS